MSVAVVVAWRGGCPYRERALAWVRARYAERHPQWELVVAEAPPGPWVKAEAVMPAIGRTAADIVVIADADVWCDGLGEAVSAVREGAVWAIPHRTVRRLTEGAVTALLAGTEPPQADVAERPYPGVAGGGYVIAHREVLLSVPLDPRFVGWGQEDEAWATALTCLAGPPWRGEADLIHLWHPPQERLTRRRGSPEGWQLRRRYVRAKHDPSAMRALLNEIGGTGGAEADKDPDGRRDQDRRQRLVAG